MKKRKCFIRQSEKLHHKLNVNLTWSNSKKEGDSLLSLSLFNLQCEKNILIQKKMREERPRFEYHRCARLSFRTQLSYEASQYTRFNARVCLLISGPNKKKTCILTWLNWFQYYFGMLIFRHLTLLKKRVEV